VAFGIDAAFTPFSLGIFKLTTTVVTNTFFIQDHKPRRTATHNRHPNEESMQRGSAAIADDCSMDRSQKAVYYIDDNLKAYH
jgi:hypothetical protein